MNIFKKRLVKNEKGAAAVEFAIVLPILVALVFGIFEFGLALNDKIALNHAASEGARFAAVGGYKDPANVENYVEDNSPSIRDYIEEVAVQFEDFNVDGIIGIGDLVTVTVIRSESHIEIPFFPGKLIKDIQLQSSATMRIEQ